MGERICYNCGHHNHENSDYCTECGANLGADISTAELTWNLDGTKSCPRCGTVNNPNATFCIICGTDLSIEAKKDNPNLHACPSLWPSKLIGPNIASNVAAY